MAKLRVHASPVSDPDLLCLADLRIRPRLHEGRLGRKLFRQPEIVRVEEGEIVAAGIPNAPIARRGDAAPCLREHPHGGAVARPQFRSRAVLGAVVDHDELEGGEALGKNGIDRLADHRPAVAGRDDDAYNGFHLSFYLAANQLISQTLRQAQG